MDKNSVTRTFSIGAISNRTKASDDFYAARRHSSAGIRALLWATSNARSFGCSLGSDSQTSRENIFPNILTPDSIPQFTIPSLSVQSSLRSLDKDTEEDDAESEGGLEGSSTELEPSVHTSTASSSSTSSSRISLLMSDRKAERSVSDPFSQRRSLLHREVSRPLSYLETQHCLDPASRAALSLPHLTKVTTPYGFVTLSQSPQMADEEALLCQAGLRRATKDEDTTCCPVTADKKKLSKDSEGKGSGKAERRASSLSSNTVVSSSTTSRQPDGKCKRRFYEVIKKHFTSRH